MRAMWDSYNRRMHTPDLPAVKTHAYDGDDHPEYKRGRKAGFKSGFLLAFMLALILNSMPFADAYLYKKAISECEKTLPRDKTCTVQGVVVQTTP